MPSGSYIQADVLCPFYMTDTCRPVSIKCEGISDNNNLTLTFRLKDDKISYMREFCTSCYKNCYLYKIIYDKYDESILKSK